MEELTYRLDQYEGPLDLLLSLIAKNKVSIIDIPIASICDQYMEFIENARRIDLNIASEFIVMASELMLIKSKMLLPRESDDREDPRKVLVDALLLYQKAKENAKQLRPFYDQYSGRMAKEEDEILPEKGFPIGLDPNLLTKALSKMLNRIKDVELTPSNLITPLISHKVYSVEEKIDELVYCLRKRERASLFTLLSSYETKSEILAAFLGLLEMIKTERVIMSEADDSGEDESLTISFTLNPDYVPPSAEESAEAEDQNEYPADQGN